ncbi:sugar ABC transporter ATP-binding protein [Agathobaculum sp. NTUH-O15-33]|uniref:sugar ABC transporter ATP-binding protein n=1 Tax=Agathobaculum sp. NTUH-O15-33 TaxID=3079302 RepID=UPI002958B81C|nr:sugar ABC transporter ATP-binding protein [Agathobaculum sp. NTUH-O15-33]WNX84876.1 sugar ABC transporter ATP-binding protein [Agathobaculum sp. NTUH-O15-33]
MDEYILEMQGISKHFPGVQALRDVQLRIRPGTVHSLMGENGAGKSTLMKCLFGIYRPDEGTVRFLGKEVQFTNTLGALQAGISMIHQELSPIRDRAVWENFWIGRQLKKYGLLTDDKRMIAETTALFERLHIQIDPKAKMGDLTIAKMQLVEIAKAVSYNASVVIMDEPTSALTVAETEQLFDIISQLKEQGVAIIYISHKMEEIFRISDEITVLRDGQYIASHHANELDTDRLIALMVGRTMDDMFPKAEYPIGDVVMKVENLACEKCFSGVSFELRRGEILGFAGLVGAGRTEVIETIFGVRRKAAGTITLFGQQTEINTPRDAIKHKLALVTEDRRGTGIIPVLSVERNITISSTKNYRKYGLLNVRSMREHSQAYVEKLNVRTPSLDTKIENLSGGNQQKALVARWLLTNPDILMVDEPTRGIDVGAKAEIHSLLSKMAGEGKAIIMVSSEMQEVLAVSDRILVMHEGKMSGIVDRKDFSQEKIMKYAAGLN